MEKHAQQGFTLYELMITVAIVAMVLAFGVPNLVDFRQNSRMTVTANNLHSAFHMARSEAARSKSNITICASADPFDANATCDGTWETGYIVFVDGNADLNRFGADENVLRAHGPIEPGVELRVANDATYFMFAATGQGRLDNGSNATLSQVVMCDDRGNITAAGGNSAARLFVTTPLGRATIIRDKNMIDTALDDMGETCP